MVDELHQLVIAVAGIVVAAVMAAASIFVAADMFVANDKPAHVTVPTAVGSDPATDGWFTGGDVRQEAGSR